MDPAVARRRLEEERRRLETLREPRPLHEADPRFCVADQMKVEREVNERRRVR